MTPPRPEPKQNSEKEQRFRASPRVQWPLVMGVVLLALGTAVYQGYQASQSRRKAEMLQREVARLDAQLQEMRQSGSAGALRHAPHLPGPAVRFSSHSEPEPARVAPTGRLFDRFKDDCPVLTQAQAAEYLNANGRKAASLLAAYRTSADASLLTEAMRNFPNDPQVAFEVVFSRGLPPEQRRQWLTAFEQSAPDNALANYLSALDYFKAGQTDRAIEELTAASAKPRFEDYTLARWQDNEEAYLSAGYSAAEAKLAVSTQLPLPQLAELKQLGVQMVELSNAYRSSGDEPSARAVLDMAISLGSRYRGDSAGDCAISHLVGLSIEGIALKAMDPASEFEDSRRTVAEQLKLLTEQKTAISTAFKENEALLQGMSEQDWISYIDRQKSFGDEAALQWVLGKLGPK